MASVPAAGLRRHDAFPEGVACLRNSLDLGALEAAFLPAALGYSGKS
jgi:hypothetical protein